MLLDFQNQRFFSRAFNFNGFEKLGNVLPWKFHIHHTPKICTTRPVAFAMIFLQLFSAIIA